MFTNGVWYTCVTPSSKDQKNPQPPFSKISAETALQVSWFSVLPLGVLRWPHGVFHSCPWVPDTSFLDDIHEAGRARRTFSTKPEQGGLFHQTWGIVWSDILNNIWNNRGIRRNKGRLVTPCSCLSPRADRYGSISGLDVSCHSHGPWEQNKSSFSSRVLARESLGRRTKYQCRVQVLRILAESFDGKVKSVYKFCSEY